MSDDLEWTPRYEELVDMVELLFEMSPDMVCVAGADGFYKKVNSAWRDSLGYSLEEMLKFRWLDLVHPEDAAKTLAAANTMEKQKLVGFSNRLRHKDGSYVDVVWRASSWAAGRTFAIARLAPKGSSAPSTA